MLVLYCRNLKTINIKLSKILYLPVFNWLTPRFNISRLIISLMLSMRWLTFFKCINSWRRYPFSIRILRHTPLKILVIKRNSEAAFILFFHNFFHFFKLIVSRDLLFDRFFVSGWFFFEADIVFGSRSWSVEVVSRSLIVYLSLNGVIRKNGFDNFGFKFYFWIVRNRLIVL